MLPDQAPEAAQLVALELVQEMTVVPPGLTVLGLACSATAGNAGVTVTVVD
jgi:hypothetical protein